MEKNELPKQELLEAIISELKTEAKDKHGPDGKEDEDCELCILSKYLITMKNDPINNFIGDALVKLPTFPVLMLSEDAADIGALCRAMFLIGLKAGRTQSLTLDNIDISE